jgi:hypothetical protein
MNIQSSTSWNRKGPAFLFPRKVSERVMYPWPIGDFDNAMDEVLDIANAGGPTWLPRPAGRTSRWKFS